MRIINFSHPLTPEQIAQIEAKLGEAINEVRNVRVQFDTERPFEPQVVALLDGLNISPEQWHIATWIVILPALNFITAVLLAEIYGRSGRLPTIIRLKPVKGPVSSFELAEVIPLEAVKRRAFIRAHTPTEPPTPEPTPTNTPTPEPTATPTEIPTNTPEPTATATATPTQEATVPAAPTPEATAEVVTPPTATPTAEATAEPTAEATPEAAATVEVAIAPTVEPTPEVTATVVAVEPTVVPPTETPEPKPAVEMVKYNFTAQNGRYGVNIFAPASPGQHGWGKQFMKGRARVEKRGSFYRATLTPDPAGSWVGWVCSEIKPIQGVEVLLELHLQSHGWITLLSCEDDALLGIYGYKRRSQKWYKVGPNGELIPD